MSNDSYLEDVGQSAAGSGQGAVQQVTFISTNENETNDLKNKQLKYLIRFVSRITLMPIMMLTMMQI
jgi:hypothetical protein